MGSWNIKDRLWQENVAGHYELLPLVAHHDSGAERQATNTCGLRLMTIVLCCE